MGRGFRWKVSVGPEYSVSTSRSTETFHLKPRAIASARGSYTAEMWFAPSLLYLPVRIKLNMGEGTYLDLVVEKIEQAR